MTKFAALFVAAAGLISAGQAQAQNANPAPPPPMGPHGGHGMMSPDERMNRLSQELNLTDQQKTNVEAVFDNMREKIQTAVEQAKTNADTQLQGILTPEQYQKLQSMWEQRQQQFHHHPGGGGAANPNSGQ